MRSVFSYGLAAVFALLSFVHRAAADELYVSNFQSGTISKVDTGTGTVTPFAGGLVNPGGLAFDKSGNLYVAIRSDNMVKFTPDGVASDFGPAFPGYIMSAAAVDSAGNVYASGIHPAGTFIASIFKLSPAGSLLSTWSWTVGNGPLQPAGLAFDGADNLYTADYSGNKVWKITPGGTANLITPLFVNPQGVALDSQENLFVSLTASGTVAKVLQNGSSTGFAGGLSSPAGLTFDTSGNLFAATGTTLTKLNPQGTFEQPITGLHSAQFIANRTTEVPEPHAIAGLLTAFCCLAWRGRSK